MSIKVIIDTDAVRDRYSLADKEDINTAIDSSLTAAHVFFQGILGTEFELHTDLVDIFFLDEDLFTSLPNNQFRLRLRQAFVKPDSITIKFGGTRKLALEAEASILPTADYHLDPMKGLIYVDSGEYNNQWCVVTYTAGLGTGGVAAPDWLKEAVLAWVGSAPLFSASNDEPDKTIKIARQIQQDAAAMVDRYKRETAFQLTPVY